MSQKALAGIIWYKEEEKAHILTRSRKKKSTKMLEQMKNTRAVTACSPLLGMEGYRQLLGV